MTERSEIISALGEFSKTRILVVGDILLDRFIVGEVERISPEAPIPILRVTDENVMLGGAGNVARNLAALGVNTTCVSVIGNDAAGDNIELLLDQTHSMQSKLIRDEMCPTFIKARFLAGNQQMMRADWEGVQVLSEHLGKLLIESACSEMKNCDAVVLSDYGKRVLQNGRSKKLIDSAHAQGLKVFVDPKSHDFSIYENADIVTPNRKELLDAADIELTTQEDILEASQYLCTQHKIGSLLVTQSSEGMTLVDSTHAPIRFPAVAQEVFDVSGAGDTVIAVISAAVTTGLNLHKAAKLANIAAGIVVGKVGTAVVHAEEIIAALHHEDLGSAEAKLLSSIQIQEQVSLWRRQGLKVGFANGCFDLLHPGHISLLAHAKSACDRLIVALNSDTSIKRLKGSGRPIQNQAARATVIASLETVDSVVLFSDETPIDLIRAVKPDILVKGADYKATDVIGSDLIQSWGGKVLLAPLIEGHSTTNTVKKVETH